MTATTGPLSPPRALLLMLFFLLALVAGNLAAPSARALEPAEAAGKPPVSIAVLVSTRSDVCHDPGNVGAIRQLVTLEQQRINARGGIGGRRVELSILDDERTQDKTTAQVRQALTDPKTLAVIGLSNSNFAKVTFDALGAEIEKSGVPFISDLVVNSIYAKHPNVFSTRASQDDERLPVTIQFIRSLGFQRPVAIGLRDMVFSTTFADGLKSGLGQTLAADFRLGMTNEKLDPAEVAAMVAALKEKNPDIVLLSVGTARSADVMKAMAGASVTPPIFLSGRIDGLPADTVKSYPSDLYQLAWDTLPEVFNDKLRRLIERDPPEKWLFEGRKIPQAPGWSNSTCQERPLNAEPSPLDPLNLRAIGLGTQFADMVALVAAAAASEGPKAEIAELRSLIMRELRSTYTLGRGAFKGPFETWSFDRASRAAARTPFVIVQPHNLGRQQLAPIQFVRMKNGNLRQVETLYADVDLIRIYNVDDNDKTFFAEFYLSMRASRNATVEQIDFVNAYLDPRTNGRQLAINPLHNGGPSDAYPTGMRIYKISGKFLFEPNLKDFPFDSQRFAISIQPKLADAPFVVQPPPLALRDKAVNTDGWDVRSQYVGYDGDFVPIIDAFTHEPSIVPFYTANYVWQMDRQTTDYFLRVVVPLLFILIVAYVSIFIPQSHFEAIVTIQVTALLSAVALYLSIPKLSTDTASLSDRIFVFDYMMVSAMIVISILRVNRHVASRRWLKTGLGVAHVVGVPLLVAGMAYYVHSLSLLAR
jgi:ABC-type branched-subunit amino acid transport system substrate-binding protein